MALVNMSAPGAKDQKASTLESAVDVMKIVGSLGGLYKNLSDPVKIKTNEQLAQDYAKKRASETANQTTEMAAMNKLAEGQKGPAGRYRLTGSDNYFNVNKKG